MRTIVVHPSDPAADASSLTAAVRLATSGDVILLGSGTYSPLLTHEVLPLRLPAGVAIEGAGPDVCVVDGAGQFEPTFDPIRPETAVLVLDHDTRVTGLTVTGGGAHGLGALPGASVVLHDCTVSRNGGHGLFLSGVAEAVVTGCRFLDNGLKRFSPTCPRGNPARQGHHVFAAMRAGRPGRLVISDNTLRGCFADGVAMVGMFDQGDGATFSATVLRNLVEDSERSGLLFSASFGPVRNRCRIVASGNVLRGNRQWGIGLLAAVPLGAAVPRDNVVEAVFTANEISGSTVGVLAHGAANEAHGNTTEILVDRNRITGCATNGVRLVGAIGALGLEAAGNSIRAVLSRNRVAGSGRAVVVQGAGGAGTARGNVVRVRLAQNDIDAPPGSAIVVSDGDTANRVEIEKGSQPVTRAEGDCLG
jgi:hypothetical protein